MSKAADITRMELAIRRYCTPAMCVNRLTGGPVSWGECDVVSITKSGYVTEYEIKTSVADLRRELKKERWKNQTYTEYPDYKGCLDRFREAIKYYYIVVPDTLAEKAANLLPVPNAGLLVFHKVKPGDEGFDRQLDRITTKIKATANRQARPLSPEDWRRLSWLLQARYWDRHLELQHVRTTKLTNRKIARFVSETLYDDIRNTRRPRRFIFRTMTSFLTGKDPGP